MSDQATTYSMLPNVPERLARIRWNSYSLALAGFAAALAAMALAYPSLVVLTAAVAALAFSLLENNAFLLVVVFATPLGWMFSGNLPVRNVYVLLHSIVILGFFGGRLLRGQASYGELFRQNISRASLFLLAVVAAPVIFDGGKRSHESWRAVSDLAAYVGFYFVILAWTDSRGRLRKILLALCASTIATSLFALCQIALGGFTQLWLHLYPPADYILDWEGRATSFLGGANSLAGYLNLLLGFALACSVLGSGGWKRLAGCTFVLGALALFSTQSIGGLLGLLTIITLAILLLVENPRRRAFLLAALCVSVGLLYGLQEIISPVHTAQYLEADTGTRLLLWQTAWGYFAGSPWLGVGWGNFTALYGFDLPSFEPGALAVHNIYLQLLSETGLVGFLAFFYLVFHASKLALSQWRSSADFMDRALAFGVLGAILSTMTHGFVDFLFHVSAQFGTLFWMLFAVLLASARLQGSSPNRAQATSGVFAGE